VEDVGDLLVVVALYVMEHHHRAVDVRQLHQRLLDLLLALAA
jgi:hypothetical protein